MIDRRLLLVGLIVAAAPAWAAERVTVRPIGKVFPYLDRFLPIPPAERSRFVLAYTVRLDRGPARGVRMTLLDGAQRIPLPLDGYDRVARLPTLAQLHDGARVEIAAPAGHRVKVDLDMEARVTPAAEMEIEPIAAAARQASAAARRAAGVLGIMAPRLARAVFERAAGAEVVDASGHAQPLPIVDNDPVLDFARYPQASRVRFSRPPRRVLLDKAS